MNYANDALWWKLQSPHVRALASLLTAPPLWQTGCELPVRELLGDTGFRFLLQLDAEPCRLPADLAHAQLGHYAENLLAWWLDNAPHSRLLAREWRVGNDGALDLIAKLNQQIYHIELTCKYFGGTGEPSTMIGLNPNDNLPKKVRKLSEQLALSQRDDVQAALRQHGIDVSQMQRVSVVRGMAFTPSQTLPDVAPYTANVWTGLLITTPDQWQTFAPDSQFYCLARHEYLAPTRVLPEQLLLRDDVIQAAQSGLYAQILPRDDGFGHEAVRVMWRIE
ncbi:DUF1853 family protein [Kingella kingae]|uniref:DUF1853 family protein n=1 Tax=Kingella kingae TaxID=504 RepID=UPI0003F99113|nr:DUF1853 family protein [Kingella kingae]